MTDENLNPVVPESPKPIYPGPSVLLSESWQIFKNNFWHLVGVALLPTFLNLIGLVVSLVYGGIWYLLANIAKQYSSMVMLIPLIIILIIAGMIINLWGQASLVYTIIHSDEKLTVSQAYSRSWKYIWSYLGISLLMIFLAMGGFFLLIIPFLVLALHTFLSHFALIEEGKTGLNALLRSRQLIKGRSWQLIWRFVVLLLITVVTSIIFESLNENYPKSLALGIIESLVSGGLSLYGLVFSFVNYKYLKASISTEFNPQEARTKYILIMLIPIIPLVLFVVGFFVLGGALAPSLLGPISF